ncbi:MULTISPECIES: SEL1-like repeat protein [unclassified Corallococcus]|uniref:SEL1-like repeat protein n=1 Tax=unclassified Corallococcus TaxID=2685029 RepID=UPI001A905E2F|nr:MULTISPECIES: SEL1-like repeat protein [unclassified Corallococcus]MBN9681272.1 sel1 repeat family protein [Corallococcus sp. NCSPR001]WAS87148.1 SEL1-like repeat protein [Corallococcus sp. NCRR]
MPSVKFFFAWLVTPALALLVACAHGSSDETKSEAEQELSTLYQRTCGGRLAQACFEQAERLRVGDGVPKDVARAAMLYELGCNGDDPRACVALGVLKEEGRGVAKDEAEAARLFARGCERDLPEGCGHLALLYGEGRGVTKDAAMAVRFYERGCAGDDRLSCNNLGVLKLMGGFGVEQDVAAGMGMLVQACNRSLGVACLTVAREFDQGVRTRKDARLASSYFRTACGLGAQEACASPSAAAGAKPEPAPAVTPEEGAKLEKIRAMCETGSGVGLGMACYVMGTAYEKGAGVAVNPGRATMFYQRACDHEVPEACDDVRRMLGLAADGTKAEAPKQSVLQSLQLDPAKTAPEKPKGSVLKSLQLDAGKVTASAKSAPRASVDRWKDECQDGKGEGDACARLGEVLLEGSAGLAVDVPKAMQLLEDACLKRTPSACVRLWRVLSFGDEALKIAPAPLVGLVFLETGCEARNGGPACYQLGLALTNTSRRYANPEKGMNALRHGCFTHEDGGTCSLLVILTRKLADAAQEGASAEARRSLPLIEAQGCKSRLRSFCKDLGLPLPKDTLVARNLRADCDAGDPDACADLAYEYKRANLIDRDLEEELRVAEKGCAGGSARACGHLATRYGETVAGGMPRDLDAAFARAEQACAMKSWAACDGLARLLREHRHLGADTPQVQEARARDCRYRPASWRPEECAK